MKTIKAIYNKISAFCNRYNPRTITSMIILLLDDVSKNKHSIKALRDTQSHNIDDIKAIQLTIKSMREDYESLKTYHNNLAIEYRDKTASKIDLNNLNTRINALEVVNVLNKVDKGEVYSDKFDLEDLKDELTKPSNNVNDNILMLENIINTITEAKINNACQVVSYGEDIGKDKVPYLNKYSMKEILSHYIKNDNDDKIEQLNNKISSLERINKQYERLLTSDNNYILEEIAKILVPYNNEDYLENIKDWGNFNYGNKMLVDIVDDINDRFNEFNNIYNDACDDANAKTHHNAHTKLMKKARGEENTLKKIAKVLSAYDNDGININIDDIVDDINNVFNDFNKIYDDTCDDVDNINSNQRKVK